MISIILVIAIAIVFLTIFSETASPFWGLFTIATFVAFCIFGIKAFSFNELTNIWDNNKALIIGSLVVYVFLGIGWSFYKWKLYCRKYYKQGGIIRSSIRITDNKDRISAWMMYWPFSLIWYLLNDPIVNFYNFLYHKLESIYTAISDSERQKYEKK